VRISKRHPEITAVLPKWERVRVLSEEDEAKYADPLYFIKLPNESATAYDERKPAYLSGFVNIAGSLLRIKGDTIFQKDVKREKLGSMQKAFLDKADGSRQRFPEVMQNEVAPSLAGYGTVFAVMDKPAGIANNRAQEETSGIPYITVLSPFQVVDFEWDKDGELKWFQYLTCEEEPRVPPEDGKPSITKNTETLVTWTRENYIKKTGAKPADSKPNPFGFVPVIIQAQFVDPNKTIGKSSFFATSRYIFSANNLGCASNFEVYKNSSALLAMDVQDLDESDGQRSEVNPDTNQKRVTKERDEIKGILTFQRTPATYIERPSGLIESAAKRAKDYFDLALDNEKSALSVTTAEMPASGVSKAYDFTSINGVLSAFSRALQRVEEQAFRMVGRMSRQENQSFVIAYPQEFDVRTLNEKIEFVKGLIDAKFPSVLGMREAYKSLTPEITENVSEQGKINDEIDKYEIPQEEPTNPKDPSKEGKE
jgi:hypothetical protein